MARPWRIANLLLALAVGGALLYVAAAGVAPLPPVGPAFNPGTGVWTATRDAQVRDATLHLAGLEQPVQVTFDQGGVPHIVARTDQDLFFALGYVHARFRLFQMDLIRREGEGRLAEVLGPAALPTDEFQLDLGLERAAAADLKVASPASRRAADAYTSGVNAWIGEAERDHQLPTLFKVLGYQPRPWRVLDSALLRAVEAESLAFQESPLVYTRLVRALGMTRTMAWFPLQPPTLGDTAYDTGPYRAHPPTPVPEVVTESDDRAAASLMARFSALWPTVPPDLEASNNWAVDGTRTASGKPLMANDPHLDLTLPSIWYQVDLESPSYHVSGVSFPGAPLVPIGRNQHISWGATDTQNQATLYYREETDRGHPDQYFWRGAWRPVTKIAYDIPVKGQATVHRVVRLTVHGPILTLDGETVAVDWMGSQPVDALGAITAVERASNWDEFRTALRGWTSPTQNWVYADDAGNIGIYAPGTYPVVGAPDPWLPLPGTGAADVVGTIPVQDVPQVYDPPSHFVVSANERPVGADYPYYIGTGLDGFGPGYRAAEITRVLAQTPSATVADMERIQSDDRDFLAGEIVPRLLDALGRAPLGGVQAEARDLLRGWDAVMGADSAAATVWDAFWAEYRAETFQPWWSALHVSVSMASVGEALDQDLEAWTLRDPGNGAFTAPGKPHRGAAEVMAAAFTSTVDDLARRLGGSPASWRWARVNTRAIDSLAQISSLGYGAVGAGGDGRSPNAADGRRSAAGTTRSATGPSWRMVVDWSTGRSYGALPGGQSENPTSAWYDDGVAAFLDGRHREMLTAAEARSRPGAVTWTLGP